MLVDDTKKVKTRELEKLKYLQFKNIRTRFSLNLSVELAAWTTDSFRLTCIELCYITLPTKIFFFFFIRETIGDFEAICHRIGEIRGQSVNPGRNFVNSNASPNLEFSSTRVRKKKKKKEILYSYAAGFLLRLVNRFARVSYANSDSGLVSRTMRRFAVAVLLLFALLNFYLRTALFEAREI